MIEPVVVGDGVPIFGEQRVTSGHRPDAPLVSSRAPGLPVTELREEPWGMREFNVVDAGGNRIRVGRAV